MAHVNHPIRQGHLPRQSIVSICTEQSRDRPRPDHAFSATHANQLVRLDERRLLPFSTKDQMLIHEVANQHNFTALAIWRMDRPTDSRGNLSRSPPQPDEVGA